MKISLFKKRIKGSVVDLCPTHTFEASHENDYVKTVCFDICLHDSFTVVGRCDLRVGMNEELYYLGNIGYHVHEAWRGNYYAYEACLLLFDLAWQVYQMEEIIITCNQDNIPSRKTLEKLKGVLLKIADVPQDHYCYKIGEKTKCIFWYNLASRFLG